MPSQSVDIGTDQCIAAYTNQGSQRQTHISKILLPNALVTAISQRPCLATITELNKSGTDVPAAKIVNQIIISGIPNS